MRLILGSSSQWRRDIFKRRLSQFYVSDEVSFASADIDEKTIRHDDPKEMVKLIAEAKGDKIKKELMKRGDDCKDCLLLTCDQVVVFEGKVREKPANEQEAREFLTSYRSSKPIECVNGLVLERLGDPGSCRVVRVDVSTVQFRDDFTDDEVAVAVKEGHSMTAAGGCTLTDPIIGKWVKEIRGSAMSVEGFPVDTVTSMIKELCPDVQQICVSLGKVKCLLFDMDGLLLDTERFYTIAQQKILDRFGITFTMDVKAKMMGRKALHAANIMIEHYGLQGKVDPEECVREREELLDELFPKTDLLPGVERLLLHLHSRGVPMAVATSSHRRHFDMKTTRHRDLFAKVFRHIVTGDQVENSKPHPEIFQVCLEKFGFDVVEPSEALVFEDAPLGIEAGVAAGMKTVYISKAKLPEGLRADQELPSMFYFMPEEWGLPAYSE